MIVHVLNFIRQHDKAPIDLVQLAALEMISKLLATEAERVAARVLAQHELGIRNSHRLWSHNLIGKTVLKHAILMDAGLVCKGVPPDDGLVWLHGNTGDLFQHLAGGIERLGGPP